MGQFAVADELEDACKYCATFARAKIAGWWKDGRIPAPDDPTATVTFVKLADRTYAVTAKHVINFFGQAAIADKTDPEGYFVPVNKGVDIHPPFIQPPKPWTSAIPDIALRPIHQDLPAYIGKVAFELTRDAAPHPLAFGLAVGFPTKSKSTKQDMAGQKQAVLPCVQAVASAVSAHKESDQLQFWSELQNLPPLESLSGMSGGPVFWSDGSRYGLLGFIIEAAELKPKGDETIYPGPRVHFLCQRANYETIEEWAAYADQQFPKEREALNELVRRIETRKQKS